MLIFTCHHGNGLVIHNDFIRWIVILNHETLEKCWKLEHTRMLKLDPTNEVIFSERLLIAIGDDIGHQFRIYVWGNEVQSRHYTIQKRHGYSPYDVYTKPSRKEADITKCSFISATGMMLSCGYIARFRTNNIRTNRSAANRKTETIWWGHLLPVTVSSTWGRGFLDRILKKCIRTDFHRQSQRNVIEIHKSQVLSVQHEIVSLAILTYVSYHRANRFLQILSYY